MVNLIFFLQTTVLNKHLNELMEGLTAKVFRTYNASWTLQEQLNILTNPDDTVAEKVFLKFFFLFLNNCKYQKNNIGIFSDFILQQG